MRPTAETLNNHLKNGGLVQVTTYTKSWLYKQKHAGYFHDIGGNLYMQSGNRKDKIAQGDEMLVSLRMGRYK